MARTAEDIAGDYNVDDVERPHVRGLATETGEECRLRFADRRARCTHTSGKPAVETMA